jgi:hypothetical protein
MSSQKHVPHKSLLDAGNGRSVRAAVLKFCIVAVFFCSAVPADATPPKPSFDAVVRALTTYFQSQPDFQRHDLLHQSQVSAALEAVAAAGWEVPAAKKIVELALPDNSFLVGELATPDGKKFMRKIAASPGTYSRLDRMSQLSQGQQFVSQLVGDAGGDTLITYLATTNGGRNLGEMMAGTPNGTDLNLPTGRIYTADDLLAVLKRSYTKEFSTK